MSVLAGTSSSSRIEAHEPTRRRREFALRVAQVRDHDGSAHVLEPLPMMHAIRSTLTGLGLVRVEVRPIEQRHARLLGSLSRRPIGSANQLRLVTPLARLFRSALFVGRYPDQRRGYWAPG